MIWSASATDPVQPLVFYQQRSSPGLRRTSRLSAMLTRVPRLNLKPRLYMARVS